MKRSSYYEGHPDSRDPYQSSESEDYPTQPRKNGVRMSKPQQKRIRQQQYNGASINEYSSRFERYESFPPSLLDREQNSKAIRVKFYKNRDALHKGLVVSISEKMFPAMDSLLNHLNSKIDTPQGVMFIFRIEDGKLIENVKEFRPGDECVVSSIMKFDKSIQYGQSSGPPSPAKRGNSLYRSQGPSREHVIRGSINGQQKVINQSPVQARNKPLMFTVINNTMRSIQDKMIINPQTEQSFEEMLNDMGEVVNMSDNPATALYGAVPPYKKIESFSNLRHELLEKKVESYFVCGAEGAPKEIRQKKQPPPREPSPAQDNMDDGEEQGYYGNGYAEDQRQQNGQNRRKTWNEQHDRRPHQQQQNRQQPPGGSRTKVQNGYVDDRQQRGNQDNRYADDRQPRGNQNNFPQRNKPLKQTPRADDNRLSDRHNSNRSSVTSRSIDSKQSKQSNGNNTDRRHKSERQDNKTSPGRKPQNSNHSFSERDRSIDEERKMEVDDEDDEEMPPPVENGYHDDVDNNNYDQGEHEYGDDAADDEEYDDEPPAQRQARKGPRMETPEC